MPPRQLDLAFNPAEPRDAKGRWTKSPVTAVEDLDWRMSHRPAAPGDDVGSPMHDLTGTFPDDIYQHPDWYGSEDGWQESAYQLRKVRGNPEAKVKIYRSMPAEFTEKPLSAGDWVSTSKEYARGHGTQESPEDDWPVMRYSVKAKDLYTSGDSINEWGYWGDKPLHGLPIFKGGRNQEVRIHEDGVTRKVKRRKRQADLSTVDLANARPVERHYQPPRVDNDKTVRSIAKVLQLGARYHRYGADNRAEVEAMRSLLKPYGIKTTAVRMALGLTHTDSGYARGTAHAPNARLRGYAAKLEGTVRDVRDSEVYYRAAYLANAAERLQRSLNAGASQKQALNQERVHYLAHERARRGRLEAAAQVQTAANLFGQKDERGTLVGWYLNPLLKNEVECRVANGHNFYAEEGTVIGLPGSVHANCGCYAGQPHQGAALVDDVLGNVVRFSKSRPKFKLRKARTA